MECDLVNEVLKLGGHRLLCGDAECKEDVMKLLGGHKVDLLLTDPPYGIDIVKTNKSNGGGGKCWTQRRTKHHTIQEEQSEEQNLQHSGTVGIPARPGFHKATIPTHTHTPNNGIIEARQYKPVLGDDKPFNPRHLLSLECPSIIFGGNNFAGDLPNNSKWLVWHKKPSLDGKRNHFSDAELCWTNLPGRRVDVYHHTWSGMVRSGNRRIELAERVHPTQKPVGLLCDIIEDYTRPGDVVLDLYGGSGSTLIACEVLGRRCFMMELSHDYIEVITERYYNYKRGIVKKEETPLNVGECDDRYTSLDNWMK